jgi:hypothetical protein
MHRGSRFQREGERGTKPDGSARTIRRCAPALIAGLLLFQCGCLLFHRHRTPAAESVPQSPVRVAFLPLNTPPDNPENRWLSLAAPIMLAKAGEDAPDVEIVPLWESMPIVVQALGTSRSIGPDQASYIAGLLSARWAATGEFTISKNGFSVLVDFMPAKETLIPFRYERQTDIKSLQANIREALTQFVRYQIVKPTEVLADDDVTSLRDVAQALDLEYGWFTSADPGKSEKAVMNLARSDSRLAQALFNPNLYPAITKITSQPKKKKPAQKRQPTSPNSPWGVPE